MMRRLLPLCLVACACGEPPYLQLELSARAIERASDPSGMRIEGDLDLLLSVPAEGEQTKFLLIALSGIYDYAFPCNDRRADLQFVSSDRFPVVIDPGVRVATSLVISGDDPGDDGRCGPPEALRLEGSYYDSVRDDFLSEGATELRFDIPLALEPVGETGPSDWTCVGQGVTPGFVPGGAQGVVWVRDFDSSELVGGARVRVCALDDAECIAPIDEGVTDVVGVWTLEVPTSQPYYFEVDGVAGMVPGLFFEHVPPPPMAFERVLTPFSDESLGGALADMGVVADPARGHVAARVTDCEGEDGVGVSFDVGASSSGFTPGYFENGGVSASAESTTADAFALLANAAAVTTAITARLAATDDAIGTRTVHVRAGAVSFLLTDPKVGD